MLNASLSRWVYGGLFIILQRNGKIGLMEHRHLRDLFCGDWNEITLSKPYGVCDFFELSLRGESSKKCIFVVVV